MEGFIEFGLNALGFVFAAMVCLWLFSVAFSLLAAIIDTLQGWVEKNGWDK